MAHWELAEIVRAIAANLVSDNALASAVALASCCKSVEEPALGEVWRSLSSLVPLIQSFPPEVWEVKAKLLCFKRAPVRAEWTRFQQKYASKVRHLDVSSPEKEISLDALHLLQYLADCNPLLLNLVSLSWVASEGTFIPLLFISRSLTSILIEVPIEATPMLPLLLTKLSTLSPYIRDIQVKVDDEMHDPSIVEASSQLLMQCNPNRLQNYTVSAPISASALRHAIQLPSLEKFGLIFNPSICQLPNPLPTVVFPSLQSLDIEHNDEDHTWLNLLPAIENPVLSTISVQCSGPDVVQFMETFQLTMTGCDMHERLRVFKLQSREGFKITPYILACNFPFKNLTTLHVLSPCSALCQTSDLADEDIDLLTGALPGLESLMLGGDPCFIPSKITFKSLYTISHRCTRLTTLRTHFNPTSLVTTLGADDSAWAAALGLPCFPLSDLCCIKKLNVGNIPLPEEYHVTVNSVALGLVGVFPKLECLEFETDYDDWDTINDLIKAHRRMRSAFEIHDK